MTRSVVSPQLAIFISVLSPLMCTIITQNLALFVVRSLMPRCSNDCEKATPQSGPIPLHTLIEHDFSLDQPLISQFDPIFDGSRKFEERQISGSWFRQV